MTHLISSRVYCLCAIFFPFEQVNHPILMTECVCNPVASRSKMAELLFETYGVPSVGMSLGYMSLSIWMCAFLF